MTKKVLLFETALGIDIKPLMRLQLKYDMQTTHKDEKLMKQLAQVHKIAAAL